MPVIYHITSAAIWQEAQQQGQYEATSLKEEGFIHCSEERQLAGVLDRYFIGKTDLVKLIIDTDKLTSRYVQEWSPSVQDTFPHIYGPINLDAVIGTETITP
ncbi:MAG: hypothetical protein ABS85_07480 [Sphingobacteriales bacterium SCN 48-20]|jgi:uncharacterized protein (DUF952 family)|uniref:DUF952 domain-containing protein n=1 Tax=Terrimonas ferruginea TaxID=249 RepID=UPI00040E8BE0|nr:DUF952 domain-containing protein [Terrimonas ferruginea]MBN8784257.1 DUF952 domain-containing protein [Terrimonas ferruginea]ODT92959.1 MAG: hypothetical protein ABS85_07480 [Sphingobacteriales bacterium SCN 48-20]OJW39149.1 MAG: hypothetical protein BGO56_05770 [Sphingobacteriales bacterium 48-107]